MKEQRPHPGHPVDLPMFWEPALAFLKYTIAFVLAGSTAFVIAIYAFAPDQTLRALGPLAMSLTAVIAWGLLARGRIEAAVHVLAFGLWAVVSCMAFFAGGVRGMAIIVYPQLILMLGWLVGSRAAIAMAVLTVATTLGFAVAETWDVLPLAPPTPPAMRWIVQSFVFAFSVMLIVYFVRSYQQRLADADKLGKELALRSAEVQAREADLNRAQAVAHVGSWVYEVAGDIMRLSAETCRIFGLPEGTKGSRASYLARVHPEDRGGVASAWDGAVKACAMFDSEHRILVGTAIRWVRQKAELERGADGMPWRGVGTTQDVTERKRADEALRLTRIGVENASDALFWITPDARIVDVNAAACRSLGYTREELVQMRVPDVDADFDEAAWRQHFSDLRQRGSVTVESRHRTRDGRLFPVEIVANHTRIGAEERNCAFVRNIAERKRHEAEALAARNQLQATLDAIPDLLFEIGLDGRFHDYHSPRSELLIAPPEDFLGKKFSDILPPEVAAIAMASMQEAHALGSSRGKQYELQLPQGKKWFELSVSCKRVQPGQEPRFIALSRDITERRQAEEELRKRNAFVESLLENAPIGFAVNTIDDGKTVFVGRNFEKIYGLAPGSIGTSADFFKAVYVDPVSREKMRTRVAADIASGDAARMRWENIPIGTPSGEMRVVTASNIPLPEQNLMISTVQDVTESHRAQEELRQSIAFRELLLEAMPLPVFYKDTAGRYAGGNNAYARFVGKSLKDIVGKTAFEVSPRSVAQAHHDKDLDLLADPLGLQTYESRVAHADGTPHDVIFHKARMADGAGRPTGILGVITDITEIKGIEAARDRLEAQLRESQKMEALGTLAGGVAHDFNNIVATIVGNTELARQDVGPRHPAVESLEEIRKAAGRAKQLVQQILAFGRRQAVSRAVIPLAPAVEESVRLLRTTLPAGVSLRVQCAPEAPAVLADETQVEQVLLNLCANAWQAMQGQTRPGAIEVRLELHRQAPDGADSTQAAARVALPPGRYTCLTVCDNGSGMDEPTMERIFEPFFTTKPVGKGTGLGLAVVHGIVQDHGASIDVHSVPGEGTTFRVYFPAVEAPAPAIAAQAANVAPAQGQGRHILYVDDDEAIVFLMTRLLERQGYRVSGYTEPLAALAGVRAQPDAFDLVVTDYNMPGMSGLEVARALRAIRADLPVALASGYITEELRAAAPAAGVIELVYKPNTTDELCEVVARLACARGDRAQRERG